MSTQSISEWVSESVILWLACWILFLPPSSISFVNCCKNEICFMSMNYVFLESTETDRHYWNTYPTKNYDAFLADRKWSDTNRIRCRMEVKRIRKLQWSICTYTVQHVHCACVLRMRRARAYWNLKLLFFQSDLCNCESVATHSELQLQHPR